MRLKALPTSGPQESDLIALAGVIAFGVLPAFIYWRVSRRR